MPDTRYLALCAVARDETPFLREWVEYHALIGVERFIVFDHQSVVPIAETLADHVASGLVTVLRVDGAAVQLRTYNYCLEHFGPLFQWIGFIDLDEYVRLAPPLSDLRLLLADYEDLGGLALNWTLFGSSGHESRPEGLQIANYRLRPPLDHEDNIHIKTFVRPMRAVRATNPHCFEYKPGFFCANEARLPVKGTMSPFAASRARINHYYFRSREDFRRKVEKGRADSQILKRSLDEFDAHLGLPRVQDDSMLEPARRLTALSAKGAAGVLAWADRFAEPLSPEASVARAETFFGQGLVQEAELTLLHSRMRHPESLSVRLALSSLARLQGELDKALGHALEAMRLDMSLDACQEVLRIHAAAGRRDEARAIRDFVLNIAKRSGNSPDVVAALRAECDALLAASPSESSAT